MHIVDYNSIDNDYSVLLYDRVYAILSHLLSDARHYCNHVEKSKPAWITVLKSFAACVCSGEKQ